MRVAKRSHKEAALQHRVSPLLVQALVTAHKKDPQFVTAVRQRDEKRRSKLRAVIEAATAQLNS